MNIKQAAEQSGVSARNIRYYEQAGLLTPARNPENEYRIYSQADVRALVCELERLSEQFTFLGNYEEIH